MNNPSTKTSPQTGLEPTTPIARPRRILVVEDEEAIREFIRLALEDEGYEVKTANDGQYALELLSKGDANNPGFQPDLILLDMRMPRMDGWTFSQAYYQLNMAPAAESDTRKPAPILVMTAASDAARFAGQITSIGYVAKPFDLEELLALVKQFSQAEAVSTAL
jgi:two-component system phosphate regulon response regulator PhoB